MRVFWFFVCLFNGGFGVFGNFTYHILSFFINPHALERWMPENTIAGNFANSTSQTSSGFNQVAFALGGFGLKRDGLFTSGIHQRGFYQ
jgi:hypothetical protein